MSNVTRISLFNLKRLRRGVLFCVVMVSFLCNSLCLCAKEQETPGQLYSLSAAVVDGDTGRMLYGKESDVKRANASTTKIMTCIITLENASLNDYVAVSKYAASMPDVQLGIEEGEFYKLEDLLYSLMLESHNDVAVAIAEHVGGDVDGFAELMNAKASELGCENTTFLTPNGLDKEKDETFHGTSANDLAKIMAYCAWESPQKDTFLKICQTKNVTFSNAIKKEDGSFGIGSRRFSCSNHNAYLSMDGDCIAGKTGYTNDAGYCYICALESKGRHITIALLGCGWPNHKDYKWKDCKKLADYTRKNFHYRETPCPVLKKKVKVRGAANKEYILGKTEVLVPQVDYTSKNVLLADWEKLEFQAKYKTNVVAKKPGRYEIGEYQVKNGNRSLEQVPIYVFLPNGKKDVSWYFHAVLKVYFCS